ncbi:hypothetical protein BDR26DRAFT_853403 [Obelidium mucronatum]|nr:hypothetical protein BDR26DRAFT_853403 [Obelidium mucronatum]
MEDAMLRANITASSFDNESNRCKGRLCQPGMLALDGPHHETEDSSFWQSEFDSNCRNQWIQANWNSMYDKIENITIQYADLGWSLDSELQVILNPDSNTPATVNITNSSKNVSNMNIDTRFDAIRLESPQQNYQNQNPGCQLNINEIVVWGERAAVSSLESTTTESNSETPMSTGITGLLIPTSYPIGPSSTLSPPFAEKGGEAPLVLANSTVVATEGNSSNLSTGVIGASVLAISVSVMGAAFLIHRLFVRRKTTCGGSVSARC